MISQRQLYSLRRFLDLLITATEQKHTCTLTQPDRLFLALHSEERLIRSIDKFVAGAKKHGNVPLVDRVTVCDVTEELYDADFYISALNEKLRIANARLTNPSK